MNLSLLVPSLAAAAATLVLIKFVQWLFPRIGLMDRPADYGLSRRPIPYSAGLIFFFVTVVATFLWVDVTRIIAGVLIAATLVVSISFLDDRFRLPAWIRLLTQIVAAAILIYGGVEIQQLSNPFGDPLLFDRFKFFFLGHEIWVISAAAITVWLVLMMNVMNWLDGIPGLSSGISTIAQLAIFFLSFQQFHIVDQGAVITLASVLAASTAVFLFFDFYPPKLLMGDTGSMFLGFMLGALSIIAGGKFATALLIMAFPVLDALWVIIARISRGQSPFKGDYTHLHHKLLYAGFSERGALIFNYFFAAVFAGIALLLPTTLSKFIAFALFFAILVAVGIWVTLRNRDEPSMRQNDRPPE